MALNRQVVSTDDAEWLAHWEQCLRDLGLLARDNRLLHADLKKLPAGVAACADLEAFSDRCQTLLRESSSNLIVPGLACTPDNLSRRLPIIFADVYESLGLPRETIPASMNEANL